MGSEGSTAAMRHAKAGRLAKAVVNGFDAYFAEFQNITLGAQARFERADWHAVHAAMRARLDLYKEKIRAVAAVAATIAGDELQDRALWREAKAECAALLARHSNHEIAQTFFNSVYCFTFGHQKIRDVHVFATAVEQRPADYIAPATTRDYIIDLTGCTQEGAPAEGTALRRRIRETLLGLLDDYAFAVPYEDRARDADRIAGLLLLQLPAVGGESTTVTLQLLESLFFRNKAAYLVGRLTGAASSRPFVVPFLNNECGGIYADTAVFDPNDVSIIFSFTRSYFMVDASVPARYVAFLNILMPHKEVFELYNALGFNKHGKTEFYRAAVAHTRQVSDQYVIAPGIKGMVMLVFTLPSFDYVYKVIKDRFTPPKDMTRDQVKAKYRLVKRWDLAGRMADTQEFTNLAFDRRRFSPALMEELQREVPSLLEEHGRALVLKHVYVERRMTPLNLYLRDVADEPLRSVMDEYGNAIRQLAGANIFPGDMLLKNFGVTRHGRVVFYDYDELCPLTECRFRRLPQPVDDEQAMASQPWFDVGPHDVFPEEFRWFFSGNQRAKEVFDALHPDLCEPEFWCGLQQRLRTGAVQDVFPYRRRNRFPRPEAVLDILRATS